MSTMAQDRVEVTAGVDTHKDTHTAAVLDSAGRVWCSAQFRADPAGYEALLQWLSGHGDLVLVGVEGTAAYGVGLIRYLHAARMAGVEGNLPDRATRRRRGKSDPLDAEAAARAALSATATGSPKHRDAGWKR